MVVHRLGPAGSHAYDERVTGAPDAIEPAVGWRVWDVVELDGAYRLCSLAFWTIWVPGRAATAACRRLLVDRSWSRLPDHPAPDERCTCGIYATATAWQVLDYAKRFRLRSDTVHRVVGRVSLWGRVVECEGGWRASRAYPTVVYVPTARGGRRPFIGRMPPPRRPVESIALGLGDYAVPVEIVDCSTRAELVRLLERPRDPG
jgi:hypothetical protein